MAAIQQLLMAYKAASGTLVNLWRKVFSREDAATVKWLNNTAIAVGYYSTIRTSPDGYAWTTQDPGLSVSITFNDVTWTGSHYIVVGTSSTVLTSTNAINWTTQSYGAASQNITAVTSNGTIAVSGSVAGVIRTSTDNGVSWTLQTQASPLTNISRIVWNGSIFVAMGCTNTAMQIATSPDGITWTKRTHSLPANGSVMDACWTGTRFSMLVVTTAPQNISVNSVDGITWVNTVISGSTAGAFSLVWAGDKLVASFNDGTSVSTTNGTSWGARATKITPGVMCWDGAKIIAVSNGYNGATSVSLDGLVWATSLIEPNPAFGMLYSGNNFNTIVYVNSKYVATKSGIGNIYSSSDATNWNAGHVLTTPADVQSMQLRGVGGSSAFYTVCGYWQNSVATQAPIVYTSPDGNTWTLRTSGIGASLLWSTAANPSITVITGDSGTKRYSTDGITWAAGTGATTTATITNVIWANNQFVAIGANYCAVSADGINWTAGTLALTGTASLVWVPAHSVYIAGGASGAIRISSDGLTWTSSSTGNASTVANLTTNGARVVAFSNTVANNTYSNDGGTTWNALTMPTQALFADAACDGSTFLAVSSNAPFGMISSADGITWVNVPLCVVAASLTRVSVLSEDNYLAAASGNSNWSGSILSTINAGRTWDAHYIASNATLHDINYNGSQYVAVGGTSASNGTIYTSPDLVTWTARTTAAGFNFRSVAYSGSIYVAAANNATTIPPNATSGSLWSSTDGVTWTSRSTARPFYSVKWLGGQFLATSYNTSGTTGTIYTSSDGINWTLAYSLLNANIMDIAYNGTTYVAVAAGTSFKVFTSPDGVTWTTRMTTALPALEHVAAGSGTTFMASASAVGNSYISTDDGVTWTVALTLSSQPLSTMNWDGTNFIAFDETQTSLLAYTL